MSNEHINNQSLDDLVARYADLDARRAELQAEIDGIKAQLRQLDIGKHATSSGVTVSVSVNRRFNAEAAEQVVPTELLPAIQTTTIDPKKAKAVLPPAMYEQSMVTAGEPRVTVK